MLLVEPRGILGFREGDGIEFKEFPRNLSLRREILVVMRVVVGGFEPI